MSTAPTCDMHKPTTTITADLDCRAVVARHLTHDACRVTFPSVIRTFRHKGLAELWSSGKSAAVPANLQKRILNLLTVLNAAKALPDLAGFRTHPWKGSQSGRIGMDVNGPWRITFEFREQDAYLVDLEQPH